MDQGWAALLGAVVGGAFTAGATWGNELLRERTLSRNLALAVGGECAAVAEMVRRREWIEHVKDFANAAQRGEVYRFTLTLPPQVLIASRSAITHAGLLRGSLPSLVPRVVMMADGIASDVGRLFDHEADSPNGLLRTWDARGARAVYAELLALMCNAIRLCDVIVDEVNRLYPGTNLRKVPMGEFEQLFWKGDAPSDVRFSMKDPAADDPAA